MRVQRELRSLVVGKYNSPVMSILKVARMGHPVLRDQGPRRSSARDQTASRSEADRRHDRHDGRVSRRRSGGAAGARGRAPVRRGARRRRGRGRGAEPLAIINPEIMPVGCDVVEDWEGCLSIPDIRGRVPRAREITVRALDRRGERIELHAHGFSGARHPARNRSPRRRAVLRSDACVRVADVPRRVRAVLGEGRRRSPAPTAEQRSALCLLRLPPFPLQRALGLQPFELDVE